MELSNRAWNVQKGLALTLFPLEVFMDFFKNLFLGCFLDFASLNNTKVISYNLCIWETQETQQSDHTAPQGLTLLFIRSQWNKDIQQSMLRALGAFLEPGKICWLY